MQYFRYAIKEPRFWFVAIFSIISLVGFVIMQFCEFKFDFELGDFLSQIIKFTSYSYAISTSSFLLYLAFTRNFSFISILLIIAYLGCCSIILYFSFNAVKNYPLYPKEESYFLWAANILTSIGFILIQVFFGSDSVLNIIALLVLPCIAPLAVFLLFICIVLGIMGKGINFTFPGLNGLTRDGRPALESSIKKEYTITNEYGCEQTVYSSDGVHFTDGQSSHWVSDDGGQTAHRE